MSKDTSKTKGGEAAAGAAKPAGKKRMMIMLVAFVVLAAGGGGGGWFYLRGNSANANTVEAPKKHVPPTFVNLETFTVNLADREHYLQLGVTYEVAGNDTTDALKLNMPILRSKILLLLSSKTSETLVSAEGKSKLADELVAAARELLPLNPNQRAEAPPAREDTDEAADNDHEEAKPAKPRRKRPVNDRGVSAVHFSAFVIQ